MFCGKAHLYVSPFGRNSANKSHPKTASGRPPGRSPRGRGGVKHPTPNHEACSFRLGVKGSASPQSRPVSPYGRAAASRLALDSCPSLPDSFSENSTPKSSLPPRPESARGFGRRSRLSRCPKPRRGEAVAPAPVGVPAGQGVSRRRSASPAKDRRAPWGPFKPPPGAWRRVGQRPPSEPFRAVSAVFTPSRGLESGLSKPRYRGPITSHRRKRLQSIPPVVSFNTTGGID